LAKIGVDGGRFELPGDELFLLQAVNAQALTKRKIIRLIILFITQNKEGCFGSKQPFKNI
jgi:hypothetical protein